LAGAVSTDAPAKTVISGRCMLAEGETDPFRRRWERRGPRRGKTKGKPFDVTNQLELKGQKGNPVSDRVAEKVVQKYKNESCADIMAQRDQPRSAEEQNAIQLLHGDPAMRQEFVNRVAAPIADKLFECRMIP